MKEKEKLLIDAALLVVVSQSVNRFISPLTLPSSHPPAISFLMGAVEPFLSCATSSYIHVIADIFYTYIYE